MWGGGKQPHHQNSLGLISRGGQKENLVRPKGEEIRSRGVSYNRHPGGGRDHEGINGVGGVFSDVLMEVLCGESGGLDPGVRFGNTAKLLDEM